MISWIVRWVGVVQAGVTSPNPSQHPPKHPSNPTPQGVYDVYSKLRASILAEVERFRPQHVFVTGHSLGGALTHLTSHAVATRFPGVRVDAVAFASILVGDAAFMREVKVRDGGRQGCTV